MRKREALHLDDILPANAAEARRGPTCCFSELACARESMDGEGTVIRYANFRAQIEYIVCCDSKYGRKFLVER